MFGYVRPAAQRLPTVENERFHNAYCGLCHALERRCGFAARFLLNYDFTLLAILLSLETPYSCERRRCAVHPCRGCDAMASSQALDRAADYSVILAWWQLRDHIADHRFFAGLIYRFASLFLRRAYRKASSQASAFDLAVRKHLHKLAALEAARCASVDEAAEPFAALLAEIAEAEPDERRRRVLSQIFYHLGRWIYLIDAVDDLKKDVKIGNYNPLPLRYSFDGDKLSEPVKRAVGETLDDSIRRMADAYALLDAGDWKNVLDSIFYDSLYGIGKAVLEGTYHKRSRIKHTEDTA